MANIQRLLELRRKIKAKKPHFIRQDFNKKARLKKKWRMPKGLHSKIRLKLKGRGKHVSAGYGSPRKVRHLHKSGLEQRLIKSEKELESLEPKNHALIISSALGNRKKITILKKAKDVGFKVLNIRNPDEYIKRIKDKIKSRKYAMDTKRKAVGETKAEKKEQKLTEKISEEDKKELEKREKDKILTKKG